MKKTFILLIIILTIFLLGIFNCQQAGSSGGGGGRNSGELPVQLPIRMFAAGKSHTVVFFNNGTVKCWGGNQFGRLGYGDTEARGDEPGEMDLNLLTVDLGTGIRARKIFIGGDHSIVLLEFGSVKCWGSNSIGQLGYGDNESRGNDPGEMGNNLPFVSLW